MKHFHENHKIVMASLNSVAVETQTSISEVKNDFIAGNEDLTFLFWKHFYSLNPYKTKGVEYCYTCRKFILEFHQPKILWSLEYDLIPVDKFSFH